MKFNDRKTCYMQGQCVGGAWYSDCFQWYKLHVTR